MRIAILGWGSLIWDPRELPRAGTWQCGGPTLPIEFSRVSRDCRLTLVIDYENGCLVATRYMLSPRVDLDDAVTDLLAREGTVKKHIGFVDLKHGRESAQIQPEHTRACADIKKWLRRTDFKAGVWTALPSNFKSETGYDFSVAAAVEYLNRLPASAKERAMKYVRNAPEEVDTPVRRKLQELDRIKTKAVLIS